MQILGMAFIILLVFFVGFINGDMYDYNKGYKESHQVNELINHTELLANIVAQQLQYEKDIVKECK